jgi:hypothetical protein
VEPWELDTREPLIDMSFDWKGERVAIVTADRRVLVYNRTKDGRWEKNSEYSPHNGPIWKVRWAHDYLGNFLATCMLSTEFKALMIAKLLFTKRILRQRLMKEETRTLKVLGKIGG